MGEEEEIANWTFPGVAQMKGALARSEMQLRVTPAAPLVYRRRDSLNLSELPEQKLQMTAQVSLTKITLFCEV